MERLKKCFYKSLLISILSFLIFQLIIAVFGNWVLENYGQTIKAVIVDKRANLGNYQSMDKEIEYEYIFSIENNNYWGNSECSKFNIGDSIQIRYWKLYPRKNHPVWILEDQKCN